MPTGANNSRREAVVLKEDLIPDGRLARGAIDLLEHDAIAKGVAEIALNAETPVNVALFGPWGSGKSSIYSMISSHLYNVAGSKVKVARYDAWKYGGRELKRNFIYSLARELGLKRDFEFSNGLENEQVDSKLNTWNWLKKNSVSLLVGAAVSVAVAALWVVLQAAAALVLTDQGFHASVGSIAQEAGTVFGLALIATLVGPKAFEGAVRTIRTPPPEGSDQFAQRFAKLVQRVLHRRGERLVVFIDELDRCDPKDVVATLIDLKTFLDQKKCVFIVAADREVIEKALSNLPQSKPVWEDEPYYATPGAFLDKIFQHQLALPPLRSRALTKFAHDLVDDQGGIWKEMREHGRDTFNRTVFALVPVHVRSPRRVKVLLNNFATNARIMASRGIDWEDRAHEIAVLTVLQTEFPSVATDLRRVPRLLEYLRGDARPSSNRELTELLARYQNRAPNDTVEQNAVDGSNEAGAEPVRLLTDDPSPENGRKQAIAGATMSLQLSSYLAKVEAAGIRDPRPDLFYLQAAAGREGLPEPQLGDTIDLATDTAPDEVVEAFEGYESQIVAVAIPLLIVEGENDANPGRGFAYESACRLIERLDSGEQVEIAQHVAPTLIAAIKANELSDRSIPGALLVACWYDSTATVQETMENLHDKGVTDSLLQNLTITFPYLPDREQLILLGMIAKRVEGTLEPLIAVLRNVPMPLVLDFWTKIGDEVVRALNELDKPERDSENDENFRTANSQSDTPSVRSDRISEHAEREPAGEGVGGFQELVAVIRSRADHEPLLSEVLASVQTSETKGPLQTWVNENADNLFATLASPVARAQHALLGLYSFPECDVEFWSKLLPGTEEVVCFSEDREEKTREPEEPPIEVGPNVADLHTLASEILEKILRSTPSLPRESLSDLGPLASRVAVWTTKDQDSIAVVVAEVLADIDWTDESTENDDGALMWTRREALYDVVGHVATGESSAVYVSIVSDLAMMPRAIELTQFAVDWWMKAAARLPANAAKELSKRLDEYDEQESERGAALRMRMALRAKYGGIAPPADSLLAVPGPDRVADLTDSWLSLEPAPEEAKAVLTESTFSTSFLRKYCNSLTTEERTDIWLTLLPAASNGVLEAAGAGGVSQAAVESVQSLVENATREPARASAVKQLLQATPGIESIAEVRKSASRLAIVLLDKGTNGDLKTAETLLSWAGRAGDGYVRRIRPKLAEAVKKHPSALTKAAVERLQQVGLLTRPKQGPFAALLRH